MKIKGMGLESILETSYLFFYSPRGKASSYFELFLLKGQLGFTSNLGTTVKDYLD